MSDGRGSMSDVRGQCPMVGGQCPMVECLLDPKSNVISRESGCAGNM